MMTYPARYIGDLSADLIEQLYTVMRVYGVPPEARKALDCALYLQIVVDSLVEPAHIPDEEEINEAMHEAAQAYICLCRAIAVRVRGLDDATYAAICAAQLQAAQAHNQAMEP